jgi:hypothetical protein
MTLEVATVALVHGNPVPWQAFSDAMGLAAKTH